MTPEELGKFKNVDELRGIIDDAADGLNAFADATANATKKLQSVPDIFRLGELEFQARAIGQPGEGSSLPLLDIPLAPPPGAPRRTDLTPQVPGVDLSISRIADPISNSVLKLGGGSTLKIIEDLLKQQAASKTSAEFERPIIVGVVNVSVQGKADDPAATARAVRVEFPRTTLRASGREGQT